MNAETVVAVVDALVYSAPAVAALLAPVAVAWLIHRRRRRSRIWWTVPIAWFVTTPLAVGAIVYGLTTVTEALVIWAASIAAAALWFGRAG